MAFLWDAVSTLDAALAIWCVFRISAGILVTFLFTSGELVSALLFISPDVLISVLILGWLSSWSGEGLNLYGPGSFGLGP